MNILAIGNSFSQDATRYLHGIARADGTELTVVNLYIGGCPLDRHFRNMLSGEKAYGLEVNGVKTGFFVSLDEALLNRKWDIITLQQVSTKSFDQSSYFPYVTELTAHIRRAQPEAKLFLHQTWAYEKDSIRLTERVGYQTPEKMTADIRDANIAVAQEINADGIIPSGDMLEKLTQRGICPIHRDTFHASYGIGRYALGLIWYRTLTGNSVKDNVFCDFDEPITPNWQAAARSCAEEL